MTNLDALIYSVAVLFALIVTVRDTILANGKRIRDITFPEDMVNDSVNIILE